MREIGISPRFSRDKFVPLQTKQRYSTRDISSEVFLTLFFRGFVPFLSLADFVSRDKNLQVVDLQRLKSCFGELVTATTSNHQTELHPNIYADAHNPINVELVYTEGSCINNLSWDGSSRSISPLNLSSVFDSSYTMTFLQKRSADSAIVFTIWVTFIHGTYICNG